MNRPYKGIHIETGNGEKLLRTVSEDHFTLTDPFKYLTHFTLDKKAGAKGVAEKIVHFLQDVHQLDNVKIIGGDSTSSNTGWKQGAIHLIEVWKEEKLLWVICQLHTNELPLRHLMSAQGLKTSGANSFSDELGNLLKGDVQNYEVNTNFEVIHNANEMETFLTLL